MKEEVMKILVELIDEYGDKPAEYDDDEYCHIFNFRKFLELELKKIEKIK